MSSWDEEKWEAARKDQASEDELAAQSTEALATTDGDSPPVQQNCTPDDNAMGATGSQVSQWPFEEELGPDPIPEYKGKWEVSKTRCRCGKTQVSVHPAICTRVECAKCHKWIRL